MADFKLHKQSEPPFGDYEEVDLFELGVADPKVDISYTHATRCEFTCQIAEHLFPLAYTDFIVVWDDDGDDIAGVPQSFDNPLFEGYPEEITPVDGDCVRVVAYDPTYRATRHVSVMNAPYQLNPADDELFPVDGDAAYPRAVFNVNNDNDDDYAYSILQDAPVGQIIAQVLNDCRRPLYHLNACPGDGTPDGGGVLAWTIPDLGENPGGGWVSDLSFIPQEKVVSTSESPRSFIERFLAQYIPTVKFIWEPGTRLWRFHKMPDITPIDVTVNDFANPTGKVLSIDVTRSSEGRYGAIKFYGPEAVEWREATYVVGGATAQLTTIGAYAFGTSPNVGTCYWKFQITDPTFTRMARKGPYPVYVADGYGMWANASGTFVQQLITTYRQSWVPTLQARYASTEGGDAQWRTINGVIFDFRDGIVTVGDACIYRYRPSGAASKIETPVEFKIVYPAFADPLIVRYPATGYEGTAYAVGGLEIEQKEYDDALAVGYSYGLPVTTVTRLERFNKLAEHLHRQRKDLIYAGGMMLEGLRYEFARLGTRVNFLAKADDGSDITTGWENVGAWVTDVSYDLENQTTSIQFSSDQLEIMGLDPELIKMQLKIRAAEFRQDMRLSTFFTYKRMFSPLSHTPFLQQMWGASVEIMSGWFDEYGEQQ